jgi:hypothetical protein
MFMNHEQSEFFRGPHHNPIFYFHHFVPGSVWHIPPVFEFFSLPVNGTADLDGLYRLEIRRTFKAYVR